MDVSFEHFRPTRVFNKNSFLAFDWVIVQIIGACIFYHLMNWPGTLNWSMICLRNKKQAGNWRLFHSDRPCVRSSKKHWDSTAVNFNLEMCNVFNTLRNKVCIHPSLHFAYTLHFEVYFQNHAVEKIKLPDYSSPGCPGQSGPVWSLHSHQFNEVECVTVSGYSFIEIYEISLPLHNALADFPAVFF